MSETPRTCCACGGDEASAIECRCNHGEEWKTCDRLAAMTARAELAERQVAVLVSQIGETGWCPKEQTCYPTSKCSDCWAAWSRAEAVKEGGKG
jgi:hypothetical protein